MGDWFSDTMRGIDNAAKGLARDTQRALREHTENWNKDMKSIEDAGKSHGFLGAAVQTCDVFSPGHMTGNVLDELNVIPEGDEALKEGISAGVNLGFGLALMGATGGAAAPVLLLTAKDIADMAHHHTAAQGQQPPMAPQCGAPPPPSPSCLDARKEALREARAARREAAREAAKEKIREKTENRAARERAKQEAIEKIRERRENGELFNPGCDGTGYGCGSTIIVHVGCEDLCRRNDEVYGDATIGQVESEIERILNNPNLCFEDMIAELLRAIIKETEGEAKLLTKDLRGIRDGQNAKVTELDDKIAKKTKELGETTDPTRQNVIMTEINNLRDQRSDELQLSSDSRGQVAEDLKNLLAKLSEMQQALSNILNTQHETAMNAIRNIK